ncbi:hypothetical protein DPEC_G00155190 [Dallia pectoralis]|uniref:Uncharacterized protein n=1 Tax=Dallia pectoralis TaxID=75939 RepID=A0ACC2GKL2_DALPE|nr:hypothetical protein DPEC_G00155190 [Dallia pectoralis]
MSVLGVEMLFKPATVRNASLYDYACVSWNYKLDDWSTYGCSKVNHSKDGLRCFCNHATNFAVLMVFRWNFKYADPLNWIAILGCSISVIGLTVTIISQVFTRKSRATFSTHILVSTCTCLLIFTLLFMLAVENPNKLLQTPKLQINSVPPTDIYIEPDRGACTAVAALLQYFLLGTFTWNLLYTAHISFRNSPATAAPSFTVSTAVIGWGVPAVIVALTFKISYRRDNPLGYRQEEFCWLAARDPMGIFNFKLPMFWGTLIPVAFMQIFHAVPLIYLAFATSSTSPQLTRHDSVKKILCSFSLAVVFSLSLFLGYLLLITHDQAKYTVLSIIFCILTATQGVKEPLALSMAILMSYIEGYFDALCQLKVKKYLLFTRVDCRVNAVFGGYYLLTATSACFGDKVTLEKAYSLGTRVLREALLAVTLAKLSSRHSSMYLDIVKQVVKLAGVI